MNDKSPTIGLQDPAQTLAIRLGAIAAILLGLGYLLIIPVYASVGAPPHDGEAWLRYLPGKTQQWWMILWLSIVTDLLFLPVAMALYCVLGRFNRPVMVLSSALMGLFVMLDLAITWTHYATILELYRRYALAPDPAHQAAFVTGADCASAVLNTPLEIVYSIVTLSLGILLAGWVMLRARLAPVSSWLALITGVLGLLALTGYAPYIVGNALAATLWLFFVGVWMWRLSRASNP